MKMVTLNVPSLAFVVGTRALLGAGVGLLVAGRLAAARRRTLGRTFITLGALTTLPAVWAVRRGSRTPAVPDASGVMQDDRLRGVTRFPRKGDDQP